MITHITRQLAATLVASSATVLGVGGVDARTDPINPPCGAVVTTDVRLTDDLVGCVGAGLVIGADHLTIDLDGFTLGGSGTGVGIENPAGHDHIRITGGTVRGFAIGIDLLETHRGRIDHVVAEGNLVGITLGRSTSTTITAVNATANASDGISATFSDDTTIRRSMIHGNGANGLVERFATGSRHEHNTIAGNAFNGVVLSGQRDGTVRGNHVAGNGFDGIQLGFDVSTVTVARNTVVDNGERGIAVEEPGNTLTRNTVVGNAGLGIDAVAGTIDGGGNRAAGNGQGGCSGVVCR